MALSTSLRIVSYNCRGWKSGCHLVRDISDSFDFCFIQEHWLLDSQLGLLTLSPHFSSHGVSGVDDSVLLGRPYGGCGIIYRKALAPLVSHLPSTSKRFCALKFSLDGISLLFICVYFPTDYRDAQSRAAFVHLLGEIEGFLDTVTFDHLIIGGDFNVDFSAPSSRASCLSDFLRDKDLICIDQLPLSSVEYTFHSDANNAVSWIDHVFCDSAFALLTLSVSCLLYGSNLSDHLPLSVIFNVCLPSLPTQSVQPSLVHSSDYTNWDLVSDCHVEQFLDCLVSNLPILSDEVLICSDPHCQIHSEAISQFLESFLTCISFAASRTPSPLFRLVLTSVNPGSC